MHRPRRDIQAPVRFGYDTVPDEFIRFDHEEGEDVPGNLSSSEEEVISEEEPEEEPIIPPNNENWHPVDVQGGDARAHDIPEFLGATGVDPDIEIPEDVEEEISFFIELFLTDEIFNKITKWTNTRMWTYFEENNDERALQNPRNFIEVNEMKKIFGLVFLMGLNKKPKLRYYWSQNPLFRQDVFLSPESLSRDRFLHILRFLRFADYEKLQPNDSLSKVRPFLSIVQDLCKNVYIPEKMCAWMKR